MLKHQNTIQIIGVPIDLGASRRGTDAGPSALRIAGLRAGLRKMGYQLELDLDITVPQMETRQSHSTDMQPSARYKKEILEVCTDLANVTYSALKKGHVPLITGGGSFRSNGLRICCFTFLPGATAARNRLVVVRCTWRYEHTWLITLR